MTIWRKLKEKIRTYLIKTCVWMMLKLLLNYQHNCIIDSSHEKIFKLYNLINKQSEILRVKFQQCETKLKCWYVIVKKASRYFWYKLSCIFNENKFLAQESIGKKNNQTRRQSEWVLKMKNWRNGFYIFLWFIESFEFTDRIPIRVSDKAVLLLPRLYESNNPRFHLHLANRTVE